MTDIKRKISGLPTATSVATEDSVLVVQGAVTKKASASLFVGPSGADGAPGNDGADGAPGADGANAIARDVAGVALAAGDNYSSATIDWRRVAGKNKPFRQGVCNIADYGAISSTAGVRVTALAAGGNVATLLSAQDFAVDDTVCVLGAGVAHNMRAPAAPTCAVVGTTGSTTREYCIAWLSADYGWSAAGAVTTLTDAPALLGDPMSSEGHGITSDGDWIRVTPLYVDARASEVANVASLSGLGNSDGLTFTDGQIVALLGQTTASENGLWAKHSGAWTRPTTFDAGGDLAQGMLIRVSGGTLRGRTLWQLDTAGPYTVDTTSLAFTQCAAKIGVVWHRAGGAGNWEIAGGFRVDSIFTSFGIQFNDQGFRPGGVLANTLPNTTPPAAAVNNMLRTTVTAVGGGGTSITLADVNASGANITDKRIVHDCSPAWEAAYADAVSRNWRIEIPQGTFQVWKDIAIAASGVEVVGAGVNRSTFTFGPGYAPAVRDSAANFLLSDFKVTTLAQTLPGGDALNVPSEPAPDSINPDYAFNGVGLLIQSGDGVVRRVRVQGMYGGGFMVRGASSESTNSNRVSFEHCESASNYGTGFQYSGGDGNAGMIFRCSSINDYGCGFDDSSFLGNTYLGCHVSAARRRCYSTREEGASNAVFIGCYSEDGTNRPARILWPAIWIGGTSGADFDAASTGSIFANRDRVTPQVVRVGPKASVWGAGQIRNPGDWTRPSINNDHLYKVVHVTGDRKTHAATEPTWPTTDGVQVTDNNVIWECTAYHPARLLGLGAVDNQDALLSFAEDTTPRGLCHALTYNTTTRSIHAAFTGGLSGDAYSWRGLGASGSKSRAAGMLYFPSFLLTGVSTANYRRFGWSVGVPAFPGIYSEGDTFFDMSGTGRIYKAAADFGIGATWQASHAYKLGEVVYPTTPDGFCYTNIAAVSVGNTATSAASEPAWGGGTITDGTCQWQRHGVITPQWTVSVEMKDGAHLTDADATIALSSGHKRTLHVALTANRTIRLSSTGTPAKGAVVSIVRIGLGAFTLTIKDNDSSTTLHVIPASTARQVDLVWDGTNWQGPETGFGGWTDIR